MGTTQRFTLYRMFSSYTYTTVSTTVLYSFPSNKQFTLCEVLKHVDVIHLTESWLRVCGHTIAS